MKVDFFLKQVHGILQIGLSLEPSTPRNAPAKRYIHKPRPVGTDLSYPIFSFQKFILLAQLRKYL